MKLGRAPTMWVISMGGIERRARRDSCARGVLSEDAFDLSQQTWLAANVVKAFKQGHRFRDRRYGLDTKALGAGRHVGQVTVPHENHLSLRFDGDIQAILRPIIDEGVKRE